MKKNSGFTLIEILVVATIMSLLATVGVGSYTAISSNSRDTKRKADLEQIRSALEMYKSNNGVYPQTEEKSLLIIDANEIRYLNEWPKDPKSGDDYEYYGTITDFEIGTKLETASTSNCSICSDGTCNYCLDSYGKK